jgi:C4-dicarboxylate-specific signal transduction histidine kinase
VEADRFREMDKQVFSTNAVTDIQEETITTPHKGERILRTIKVPLREKETGKPLLLLGISEDITEKRVAQMQAIQAAKLAALGEMASGIGHEINNPLSVVHGMSVQMLERLRSKNAELDRAALTEGLEMILRMTDRMTKIVKGMRSLVRKETSDSPRAVKIQEILDDVLAVSQEKFRDNQIEIQIQQGIGALEVVCRPGHLIQVLLNLLANSFDAVVGEMDRWARISAAVDGSFLRLELTDSGPGIPIELRSKVMQPFFTTKEPGKGTGLGLSLSRQLIAEDGGELFIDEDLHQTKFIIRLPLMRR